MPQKLPNKVDRDALLERILMEGEEVFSHKYESDHFGGGGHVVVHQLGDKFAFSSDVEGGGPFDSFEKVLKQSGALQVTEMSSTITSSLLTAQQIAQRLASFADVDFSLSINGEEWLHRSGKFTQK